MRYIYIYTKLEMPRHMANLFEPSGPATAVPKGSMGVSQKSPAVVPCLSLSLVYVGITRFFAGNHYCVNVCIASSGTNALTPKASALLRVCKGEVQLGVGSCIANRRSRICRRGSIATLSAPRSKGVLKDGF
jgi:hypothetical protein